ncbi:dihydrolipoamide acetyltransferase family protein [Microbacterium azadirachtae]|uniref:Dihydrolipoamide acetyltransferase component of pyruvate dehydrogenase complex n=1 Tax=Microbacterium azadirachtae TaxID=582680 RepID=A0A0F0LLQ0_9MICO|nr:dihydrolipoamide acetyltransferase family protein [Microbacterium azadirachtae]KJL33175.1 Dihydrolipoyllysine-residue acetyltransferase component of pyruvate dehydrogenase complex [Microbacterium azadirachtae]
MTTATTKVFRLPDLGEGLTEAGLVQWLVQVGDTIRTDQPIAEVETAKSVVELPSPFAGVVLALHGEPGETIDVGAPVLEVADPDAVAAPADPAAPAAEAATGGDVEKDAYRAEERAGSGSGNVLIGYGTTERAGSGRRRARRTAGHTLGSLSEDAAPPRPRRNTAPEEPPASTSPSPDRFLSERSETKDGPVAVRSPLVRRLARDLGVDVRRISPTGSDGAVTRADVLRAAVDQAVDGMSLHALASPGGAPAAAPGTAESAGGTVDGLAVASRERMSPLRKAVSAKLTRSRSEIPEATVWVDVDVTELWNLRAAMAPEGGKAPSVTALVARFVLIALAEHPLLASRLSDDATEILSFDGVNLGVAADTERGLMVPVIPRAHELSVDELDAALRELATTARAGSMPPDRLRGSTFTLNNYGGLGVDGSAAIINHPDVAILGIGRMIERPWVVDGAIVARRIAQLSLVFDHRVCDGGYAASFLRRVMELLEHPARAFGRVR